jgi:uncharacterized protein YecT (DUF1311 family)
VTLPETAHIHWLTGQIYPLHMDARARVAAAAAGNLIALAAAGAVGHFAFMESTAGGKHRVTPGTVSAATTMSVNTSCEKTAETQAAIDSCFGRVAAEAQGVLDAALAKERAAIRPALVNAAERGWIEHRNAECRAEASPNQGGSIQPTIYSSCVIALTTARIATVRATTHYASL